jgi:CCR4-NOT transcription complex subunit 10
MFDEIPVNTQTRIANAQLAMNIGLVLLHANQPEDAFTYLLMAVKSFPSNPRLWLRLAECCIEAHGNVRGNVKGIMCFN